MASVVDKFVFALMLDAKGFKQGAETAMSALGSIKNAFLKTYSLVGGLDLFKNMLYTYTDASKSIDDFSLVTGENIYQLQAWQKAIQDTGGDINGLQGTIRKFTDMQAQLKRYGTASGIEEFLRVGIDPRGKSAFQILQQVGKLLSTIKDDARAFNIARNLGIDESTFIMLRRYGDNFDKVIKANEKYAFINRAAIAQTREYNRIVSSFKTSWLQFSQGIMKEVLPALESLFPKIEEITRYLLNESLPVLGEVIKGTENFVQKIGSALGSNYGEGERKVKIMEEQAIAKDKALLAGLSSKQIRQMDKLLENVQYAHQYSGLSSAYINLTINAPKDLNEKQLAQYTTQQLSEVAEKWGVQLGGMQK